MSSRFSSPARRSRRSTTGRRSLAGLIVAVVMGLLGWYFPGVFHSDRSAPAAERHTLPAGNTSPAGSAEGAKTSAGYTLAGSIEAVSDGDTLALRTSDGRHRIRLDSIDAPEIGHGSEEPGQPFGRAARDHLAGWVAGKSLTAQCYGHDQYGRDLCDLVGAGGESANREMVRAGYAWAYTAAKGRYLRDAGLPKLQDEARAAKRGLWAQGTAVRPWQWRYDCWKQGQCK